VLSVYFISRPMYIIIIIIISGNSICLQCSRIFCAVFLEVHCCVDRVPSFHWLNCVNKREASRHDSLPSRVHSLTNPATIHLSMKRHALCMHKEGERCGQLKAVA
jgi:hypothetical protein